MIIDCDRRKEETHKCPEKMREVEPRVSYDDWKTSERRWTLSQDVKNDIDSVLVKIGCTTSPYHGNSICKKRNCVFKEKNCKETNECSWTREGQEENGTRWGIRQASNDFGVMATLELVQSILSDCWVNRAFKLRYLWICLWLGKLFFMLTIAWNIRWVKWNEIC